VGAYRYCVWYFSLFFFCTGKRLSEKLAVCTRGPRSLLLLTSKPWFGDLCWCQKYMFPISIDGGQHVRGTPGSGKSTLMGFLSKFVRAQRDSIQTVIKSWKSKEDSRSCSFTFVLFALADIGRRFDSHASFKERSYDALLQQSFEGGPVWLSFDDAQDTYWDTELWNGLFKEVLSGGLWSRVHIVCFASYPPQ
jgi:hypothetical protein